MAKNTAAFPSQNLRHANWRPFWLGTAQAAVKHVSLLGSEKAVQWSHNTAGLSAKLPEEKLGEAGFVLKIVK